MPVKIESEKTLEAKLRDGVKKLGGWCIKLPALHVSGLPDRLALLPGGRVFFAELKTTRKKPTGIQLAIHAKLRRLGFRVEVLDTSEQIKKLLSDYETTI